jgi:hypothetical protein
MWKAIGFGLLVGLFATASWGLGGKVVEITSVVDSLNISVGGVSQATVDSTADDFYVFVGGKLVDFEFEPDVDGVEALAQIAVYTCMEKDTASCREFEWDSDFDGVPDTNILTGDDDGQRGVSGVMVPFYLLFDTIVAPTSGIPVLSIGAVATGL